VLGAAAVVAGVPVAALLLLAVVGWAPVGAALAGIGATLLAALVLGLCWARDLDLLAEAVHHIGADGTLPPGSPVLPGMRRLGVDLERLARRTAARTALIEQLRRTDGTVVERLPDPLIVLAEDRGVRRANSAARDAFGAVRTAGVHNDHFVSEAGATSETTREICLLIERDEAEGDFHEVRSLAASSRTASVSATLRSILRSTARTGGTPNRLDHQ